MAHHELLRVLVVYGDLRGLNAEVRASVGLHVHGPCEEERTARVIELGGDGHTGPDPATATDTDGRQREGG